MSPTPQSLAITMGDPAGIGPEIIAKAHIQGGVSPGALVLGDLSCMQRALQFVDPLALSGWQVRTVNALADIDADLEKSMWVLQACAPPNGLSLGQVSAQAGRMAADSIKVAAGMALRGEIDAVVTAPLNKTAMAAAGEAFPGHTEMLQSLAAQHKGVSIDQRPVRMMLANNELRTVLVSIHLPLRQAIEALTRSHLLQTLQITHTYSMPSRHGIPRIAVAGLNPHAGESGLMGHEEIDTIVPTIAHAQSLGMNVQGPFAPDTVFMRARSAQGQPGEFDVVVAMYHDQGLIPIKYLGLSHGVNITLGLPFVRTSPDHGTAYDLVGTGRADPSSLVAAVHMAQRLSAQL